MGERRSLAFEIAKTAYASSRFKYTLLSVLSYILHGYVKITGTTEDGLPLAEKTGTDREWDIREEQTLVQSLAVRYIQELSARGAPPIVSCFQGLLLLQNPAEFDAALEALDRSFRINRTENTIGGSCLGCFVYAAVNTGLSPGERRRLLTLVWNTVGKELLDHSVDSFDFAYVLTDIKTAWRGIKRRFPELASGLSDAGIDHEIQALSDICSEEDKKWNP